MSRLSTYYENKFIDHMLRGEAFEPPEVVYLGLLLRAPTFGGADEGEEVRSDFYRRLPVTLAIAEDGVTRNVSEPDFGISPDGWGTITAVGLYDAERGGHLLTWSALTEPVSVRRNEGIMMTSGGLEVGVMAG